LALSLTDAFRVREPPCLGDLLAVFPDLRSLAALCFRLALEREDVRPLLRVVPATAHLLPVMLRSPRLGAPGAPLLIGDPADILGAITTQPLSVPDARRAAPDDAADGVGLGTERPPARVDRAAIVG
jgi:hypothetical protein